MARDISDYEKENPNARQQNDEWRKQRAARGEDPNDAEAYRQHEQAISNRHRVHPCIYMLSIE